MTRERYEELEEALLSFVLRATKEEATEAEVKALPSVASVLATLIS